MPANTAPMLTLGYVILYVQDVAASLVFYERAFSLARVSSMMTTAAISSNFAALCPELSARLNHCLS